MERYLAFYGTQTRDFIHVYDVISANMHAITKHLTGIYHVGTGIETSVNELWNILNKNNPNPLAPEYREALSIQRSSKALDGTSPNHLKI